MTDALTLAAWMELALYDPTFGYYTSGTVAFGEEADFWTFPERLSPTFGRVVARHLVAMHRALVDSGELGPGDDFTVLELGAGEGWLAEDILAAIGELAPLGAPFAACARALVYRIGDRAPALRERQRARLEAGFASGRVAHLAQDPAELMPHSDRFTGVVLSNELFDVYPHDALRVPAPGVVERLHLQAALDYYDLSAGELVALARKRVTARGDGVGDGLRVRPRYERWSPPPATASYLTALEPALAHHRALGHTPELLHAPAMQTFVDWVADHLRAGFVLTVDYGGAATHCLDPAPALPQLRVYPEPDAGLRRDWIANLELPGLQDVTVDIDFTHLAHAGAERGLEVVHFGPQGDLARGPVDLPGVIDPIDKDERARVVRRLKARGVGEVAAQQKAYVTARAFASGSAGFRVLVQKTAGVRGYGVTPASDPVRPADLVLLERRPEGLLPPEVEAALRPEGDVLSDLEHAGFAAERHRHCEALLGSGLARRAGEAGLRAGA